MKIADVQAIPLSIPMKPMVPASSWTAWAGKAVIVRVRTDEGLVGVGEAFAYGAPLAVCNVIDEGLKPLLLGQDPARIGYLTTLMHRGTRNYGRRGLGMFAISGVEIALWDLLGKRLNAPLYELLGGAVRSSFPAYASLMRYDSPEDVAAACRHFAGLGFGMLKLHQTDVESVRAAREAVGPDVELMLDTNCPWSPPEALAMARALEPHHLFWLEEPVWPPEDYDGLASVTKASPIRIASGENEATHFGFREMIARRAVDVLQPSISKVGGVAEVRKIAALAATAGLPVALHSFYFGPALAATLHLAATLDGTMPTEFPTGEHQTPLLTRPIQARDGRLEVPTGPGLGVDLNEDAIRQHPYVADEAAPFLL